MPPRKGSTDQTATDNRLLPLLFIGIIATSVIGLGILTVAATNPAEQTQSAATSTPPTNLTDDRDDPTNCHGDIPEYAECEINGKSEYTIKVISDANLTDPENTTNATTSSVIVLVYSVKEDQQYLERFIRFRVSDYSPDVAEYFLDRGIKTILANERTVNNRQQFINITNRTAIRTVQFEQDRTNETIQTAPNRAEHHATYSVTKATVVVAATETTVPRLIDTSDDTIQNSPNRTTRAVNETGPATQETINRSVNSAPGVVESIQAWIEYQNQTVPKRVAQFQDDATNATRTVKNPTDEGPDCNNGGVIEYSRCEVEYKGYVARYLINNTDTNSPIDTALLYISTTTANASDIQENDIRYYDDNTEDPLVQNLTAVTKAITAPIRVNATDDDPDCSGEEAEYTRCEAEYKTHVLLTAGINQTYPTDLTRTTEGLAEVLVDLALDTYANDVPYYAEQSKNRTAALRNIPQENGSCYGHEPRYTRCEAEYKTDFIIENTLNRTYPGDPIRTVDENDDPTVRFVNDIYNNDVQYYDNTTYHPTIEGSTYIAKNATYPSRETITADDPDCGGESIEYTRCRTEYKTSVILEDGINRTYPDDLTRTDEETDPVINELRQATIEDVNYYLQANPTDSLNRTFDEIDNSMNSDPTGPIVRGRTRELKWRTSPIRSAPNDNPDCQGNITAYTTCEAHYKAHIVLDDIFESIYPTDTDRMYYEISAATQALAKNITSEDVPYYEEKVNNATGVQTTSETVRSPNVSRQASLSTGRSKSDDTSAMTESDNQTGEVEPDVLRSETDFETADS